AAITSASATQALKPLGPADPATAEAAQPPARPQQAGSRQGGVRPSIRGAQQQAQAAGRGGRGAGFQRAEVNASGDSGAAVPANDPADLASPDLAQSSNDALVIGGSVSSGIGMPQENDWFGGRGMGMGPGDGMGFGG